MGFHLERKESLREGYGRILAKQADHLARALSQAGNDPKEAIHEARKRCKRARSIARLLRPRVERLYLRENAAFREIAGRLSRFRDADVRVETFEALVKWGELPADQFPGIRALLATGQDIREEFARELAAAIEGAQTAQERLDGVWLPKLEGFDLVAPGMRKTYRRGRKAMMAAYAGEGLFHDWRKRVKDLTYQLTTFQYAWPELFGTWLKELERLETLLGLEHDLTALGEALAPVIESVPQAEYEAFAALLERRAGDLQAQAALIGRRIYAEKPGAFVARVQAYWEIWKSERKKH